MFIAPNHSIVHFCGPGMVFTNVINPRAEIDRKREFQKTLVRRGATIGANATVLCGITIGRYAFIGAGAVVTRDVPDYALVTGNPARRAGSMCRCGVKLPKGWWKTATCHACGDKYRMTKGGVEAIKKDGRRITLTLNPRVIFGR